MCSSVFSRSVLIFSAGSRDLPENKISQQAAWAAQDPAPHRCCSGSGKNPSWCLWAGSGLSHHRGTQGGTHHSYKTSLFVTWTKTKGKTNKQKKHCIDMFCYISSSMPLGLVLCMWRAPRQKHLCIRCCLEEDRRETSDQGNKIHSLI